MICFNCNQFFQASDSDVGMLDLVVDGESKGSHVYCSKKCTEGVLSNLNSDRNLLEPYIRLDRTTVTSERYPFRMVVHLTMVQPDIKTELRMK